MKKIMIVVLVIACLLQAITPNALAVEDNGLRSNHALVSEKHTLTAQAAILFEINTKTLVYAHNPDQSINPTGLIKLLSALIVLEEGNLEDVVTVKHSTLNSLPAGAVSAGLKAGEEITLRDLLYCVMVASANDAAAVMAEHVAGSQAAFVDKMNARAATLGCVNTYFANVHGLKDDRQHSTARDLAILTAEALGSEQFRQFFAVTRYVVPPTNKSDSRNLKTTNYMMDPDSQYFDERITGGKPAAATSTDRSIICTAKTENAEYLCVLISSKARSSGGVVTRLTNFDEATKLLSFGFDGFVVQQVLDAAQPFGLYEVSGGENHVVVGPDTAVSALLPIEFDPSKLEFHDVPDRQLLVAPLTEGVTVGTVQIYYDSVLIGQTKLLARHSVASTGTTIQFPDDDETGGRVTLGAVLLWTVFVVLLMSLAGVAVLVVLRRVNMSRHRSAKRGSSHHRERKEV